MIIFGNLAVLGDNVSIVFAAVPLSRVLNRVAWLAASLLFLAPVIAKAEVGLPDPATITGPSAELLLSEAKKGEIRGYFYLTNNKVSFSEAYSDFSDCYRFLAMGPLIRLPAYVPWIDLPHREESRRAESAVSSQPYGLVGAAMSAILLPGIERMEARLLANTRLRICMVPRGYVAHRLSKEVWMQINSGSEHDMLLRQAKVATMISVQPNGGAQ